jgi:hypothetical protein
MISNEKAATLGVTLEKRYNCSKKVEDVLKCVVISSTA